MKFNRNIKRLMWLVLIIMIITGGCVSYNSTVTNKNVAFLYNPVSSPIHPAYTVFHNADSSSQLFFSIALDEVLFSKLPDDEKAKARIHIAYKLYYFEGKNQIADSNSITFQVLQNDIQKEFINYLPFKTKKGRKYIMEVTTRDLTRNAKSQKYFTVDRRTELSRQNYLVTDKNETPYFQNFFDSETEVFIQSPNKKTDTLFVSYFRQEFPLPAPPFSVKPIRPENIKPDTVWTIPAHQASLFLQEKGMYHIQADTSANEGLTLLNFGKSFPFMNTPEDLMKPIRFLTQKKEYARYEMFAHKKLAVDEFWLGNSGNINRAKELIRIFYNRVAFANVYFSSHKEGWKTDRGMIYIIYGPPGTIYKTNNTEQWLYGDNVTISSMNFVFNRMENPFSDNNYILSRNEAFATSWYQAVETWRDGRVYSISN